MKSPNSGIWSKLRKQCFCYVMKDKWCSVQLLSCVWLCNPMDCSTPDFCVHHQLLEVAQTHVHQGGCYPTISSFVISFSSHLQSFLASGSFQMSQFFASGGQSIGVSASALVLPMNIQDWFTLGWTGFISLQSKELSRVFSNTTVQKQQFFGTQLIVQLSHPYMTTGKNRSSD